MRDIAAVIIFLFGFSFLWNANSLADSHSDSIFHSSIKSVLFYKSGKINSLPVINLSNPAEMLTLSFEDLRGGYREYKYTIIHCSEKWEPDHLNVMDYLEGPDFAYIENYNVSFNTFVHFTNYWAIIPGENTRFKLSGNYLLTVFDLRDNQIIMQRRFYVVDPKVSLSAEAKRPSLAKYIDTRQEIDFSVDYSKLNIPDPMNDFYIVIRQNQRWDNQVCGLKPQYILNNKNLYDYESENLFDGNSEFRYIDLRSYRYPGWGVAKIVLDSIYQFYLMTDQDRSHLTYGQWKDINGNRIFLGDRDFRELNEIDYAMVHFSLSTSFPFDPEEKVYLFGALTDWKLDENYLLQYNPSTKLYYLNTLLKQGYYNYYYAILNPSNQKADCTRFQGSHYETENDYVILVYLKNRFFNAYELVGIEEINTVQK